MCFEMHQRKALGAERHMHVTKKMGTRVRGLCQSWAGSVAYISMKLPALVLPALSPRYTSRDRSSRRARLDDMPKTFED